MTSAKFETVKRFYDLGLWDEYQVGKAAEKKWITAEEYRTITGKDYQA